MQDQENRAFLTIMFRPWHMMARHGVSCRVVLIYRGSSVRICVIGLRGILGFMGGVETHCEELMPRIAGLDPDFRVTVAGRKP